MNTCVTSPFHALPFSAFTYSIPFTFSPSCSATDTKIRDACSPDSGAAFFANGFTIGLSIPPGADGIPPKIFRFPGRGSPAVLTIMLWTMLAPALSPPRKIRLKSPYWISHGSGLPDIEELVVAGVDGGSHTEPAAVVPNQDGELLGSGGELREVYPGRDVTGNGYVSRRDAGGGVVRGRRNFSLVERTADCAILVDPD
nr:hypothetical protein Iba_chr12fCG10100 [Ipomoea batatas]